MDSIEKAVRTILGGSDRPKTPCPDELALGALTEGTLGAKDRETVLAHVAGCSKCLELLRMGLELEGRIPVRPPENVLGRAKATFTHTWLGRIRALTSALLGAGGGPALKRGVPSLSPAFALRGMAPPESGARVSDACEYVKDLGDCEAELAVEQVYEGKCQLLIRVYDKATGKTASRVRVSLTDGANDLESLVTEKGRAVFEPVAGGEYYVVFSRQGTCIGATRIRMKGEQK